MPTFIYAPIDADSMKEKKPELTWKCLDCYRTYKGPDAEQKALNCCNSVVQEFGSTTASGASTSGTAADRPLAKPIHRLSRNIRAAFSYYYLILGQHLCGT